jgi:hypothetical protein
VQRLDVGELADAVVIPLSFSKVDFSGLPKSSSTVSLGEIRSAVAAVRQAVDLFFLALIALFVDMVPVRLPRGSSLAV